MRNGTKEDNSRREREEGQQSGLELSSLDMCRGIMRDMIFYDILVPSL